MLQIPMSRAACMPSHVTVMRYHSLLHAPAQTVKGRNPTLTFVLACASSRIICGAMGEGGVIRAAACAVRISIREYTPESMLTWLHPPTPSAMPARVAFVTSMCSLC